MVLFFRVPPASTNPLIPTTNPTPSHSALDQLCRGQLGQLPAPALGEAVLPLHHPRHRSTDGAAHQADGWSPDRRHAERPHGRGAEGSGQAAQGPTQQGMRGVGHCRQLWVDHGSGGRGCAMLILILRKLSGSACLPTIQVVILGKLRKLQVFCFLFLFSYGS